MQMAAGGQAFLITQFGLAAFRWDGQRYVARTFNFYLFPRPFQGLDRRFMCQARPAWSVHLISNFLQAGRARPRLHALPCPCSACRLIQHSGPASYSTAGRPAHAWSASAGSDCHA